MKKIYFFFGLLISLFIYSSCSSDSGSEQLSKNDNLIAEWKLDGNGNDSSGNNNNAIKISAKPTNDRNGGQNKAYYFDGVNSYIEFSLNNLPKGNSERTISGWFKSDISNEYSVNTNLKYTIFDYGELSNLQRFCLDIYSKGYLQTLLSEDYKSENDFYVNNSDYLNNNWYFFTYVYDGEKTKIYSNGKLEGSKQVRLNTQSDHNKFRIGRKLHDQSNSFRGAIDNVSFYNKALTESEILGLYRNATSK